MTTATTLHPLVMQLLEAGVQVTMTYVRDRGLMYDLNSGTKSHMHAFPNEDGSLTVELRYNEVQTVKDFDDLLYTANYARHGRPFMNSDWAALLQKNGVWD